MKKYDILSVKTHEGIASVHLDLANEKMNVVSPSMMEILLSVFEELEGDNEVKAIIIISDKKDFIAGADIKSFNIKKKGDFTPIQAKGHEGLMKLEKSKKPIIAAVHGTAFGLGTELSLACHAVVCSDDVSTKFALPEVKLGLLPGGGGTQRLPQKVGVQKALDMMLTGKNIYAKQALRMGLVDVVTNKFKIYSVAHQICWQMLKGTWKKRKVKKSLVNKFLDHTSLGQSIVLKQAKKISAKQSQGNYPAIPAIIDCVETGLKKGNIAGYQKELDWFEKLMLTPESEALRYLFFAMTDNKKNPYLEEKSLKHSLKTLGMIGAGFMGEGITEVSILKGIDVLLKDLNAESLAQAKKKLWKVLKKKIRYGMMDKAKADETINRVRNRMDYKDFNKTDIVIEAVVENMKVKKQIIKEIESLKNPEIIFASNTSSLSLTEMFSEAKYPEKCIGMHYFSPVPKMPLLEIVKTEKTSRDTIASCYDFGLKQGKTVIVVNDGPGFYVNRILAPYLNECLNMADEGVALDFIDKAMVRKGFPVGPITLLDEVGLDIAAHVAESSSAALSKGREGFEANNATVNMFKDGRLGKKNRKGFYKYKVKNGRTIKQGIDPMSYTYFKGNGSKELSQKEVQDRAILLMLNEAVMCLEEGIIANVHDGNIGAVFGIGFLPFTGGPFKFIDALGVKIVVDALVALKNKYGSRFEPRPMLVKYASQNKTFLNE